MLEKVNRVPYFLSFFIFLAIFTLRLSDYEIGPLSIIEPFFALAFLIFILDKFDLGKILNTPYTAILLVFAIYGIFNLMLSAKGYGNDFGSGFGQCRKMFMYPAIFLIGYHYFTTLDHLKTFHRIVQICMVVLMPLSVFYYEVGLNGDNGYLQYFLHYEGWIASYLFFFFLNKYFSKTDKPSKNDKWFGYLGAFVVLLTNRRGVWVATFIATFVVYYLSVKRISYLYLTKIFFIILFFIGTIYAVVELAPNNFLVQAFKTRILQTVLSVEDPTDNSNAEGSNSIAWRYSVYTQSFVYIENHPILGSGLGFKPGFEIQKSAETVKDVEDRRFHDIYIEYLVSTGLLGLFLFLFMHGRFAFSVLRNKSRFSDDKKPYLAGMFGIYISGLVWGLVANTIVTNSNFIYIMYMVMGIIVRQIILLKTETK